MNMHLTHKPWLAASAAALWLMTLSHASASLKPGDPFPDLAGFKLEGQLPEALKGKVVLIDFWASWCTPCAASFPTMEALYSQYKDNGLVVLAINVDQKPALMHAFLKKHVASFSVVRDAEQRLVAAAEAEAMPTSFLLDATGKVRFVHKGFHGEESKKKYREEIESLLKEKP